jgi:hypothetical protein
MSPNGKYEEILPQYRQSGVTGKLVLEEGKWYIRYWIPGPRMGPGDRIRLPIDSIEAYIDALECNYYEYERLNRVSEEYAKLKGETRRGEMQVEGKMGLVINVGGYSGACIGWGKKMPFVQIQTEEQLEKLIESYRYAIERAKEVQVIMFGVQEKIR